MKANNVGIRLVRDSVIIAFAVAVLAIFFTNAISEAHTKGDFSFIAALLLGALFLITAWAAIVLMIEVRNLRRNLGLAGIPGCQIRSSDKLTLASVLDEARAEVCFLGITGKRSFSDDQFKRFLESKHAGAGIRLRILLLDPSSEAFTRRAAEERESVASWKQELAATVDKLRHYHEKYGVSIEVRFYTVYPVLRLIAVDNRKIVVNFFLEGRRGTESSQIAFDDSASDLANFFVKWFNAIWQYDSQEVDCERAASKE
jgi:hypothetical protein